MSKKRSFSISRILKALAIIVLIVGVTVVCLQWWTGSKDRQAEATFDQAAGDSRRSTLVTEVTPRVIAVSKLAEAIDWSNGEQKTVGGLGSVSAQDWSPEESATIRQVLERNRPVLNQISTALKAPATGLEQVQTFPFVNQALGPLLNASRLMAVDARDALTLNDIDRAMNCLDGLRILADEAYQPSRSLGVVLGLSVERYIDRFLLDALTVPMPRSESENLFEQLAAVIPSADLKNTMKLTVTHETLESLEQLRQSTDLPPGASLWRRIIHPVFTPIFSHLFRSASLDNGAFLLLSIDKPFGTSQATFLKTPAPPRWQIHRRVAHFGTATSLNLIARTQATLALRQLLKASLSMRAAQWPGGAYPESRPEIQVLIDPDPFSGQPLEYQPLDDGRLHLAIAGGPQLLIALRLPSPRNWLDPIELEAPVTEQAAKQ